MFLEMMKLAGLTYERGALYRQCVTKKVLIDRGKKPPMSAAERQRKYRQKSDIVSIHVTRETWTLLEARRSTWGLSNNDMLAFALESLPAKPPKTRRDKERGKPSGAEVLEGSANQRMSLTKNRSPSSQTSHGAGAVETANHWKKVPSKSSRLKKPTGQTTLF